MPKPRPYIELNSTTVQRGYRNSRVNARRFFGNLQWVLGNLPGDRRRAMDVLMNHSAQCIELLDLESHSGMPLEAWAEIRDDVSDAFLDKCTSAELAALADVVRRYRVPKQFLFDMLDGADYWIRNRKFDNFEDLQSFSYRMGGAFVVAAVPILGFVKPGYEIPAIKCGQAVLLTQVLASYVDHLKQNKNMLAQRDLDDCEIVLHRLKLRQTSKPLEHLVRLYASRIEKLFYGGGQLVDYLDFDGRRSIKSLLAIHWAMLNKMKSKPESVLDPDGVLAKTEMLALRFKHLMGTEGNIPVIPDSAHDHAK